MLTSLQRQIIFARQYTQPLPHVADRVEGLERLWLEIDDGRVESWFLPADEAKGTVIFAHGNAELIDYWPFELGHYRKLGFNVYLPEYRGYGRSDGSPSEENLRKDFARFYDLIVAREDVDEDQIIYHGRSLGGGVLCQLAAIRRPAKMILESTFTSIADIASSMMLPRFMVSDPFDSLAVIRTLDDVPILIMHGVHDATVPFTHAQRLADAAKNAKLVSYQATHNDMPRDWETIEEFLR